MIIDKDLLKKFNIKKTSAVQLINAPSDFHFSQSGVEEITIVFVKSQQDINTFVIPFCKKAFSDEITLWCAYPKKSSKIKTDISRDFGWDELSKEGLEIVSLISINETWSAARFRKKPENSTKTGNRKIVTLSKEFTDLLNKNPSCKKFFDSLSFTNQKEYATWISSAKRPETLKKRLEQSLFKLEAGKKNPSEK